MYDTPHIPFDTVFIVGGTHGNERTGVTLVQHWQQHPAEVQRETFATQLMMANPKAVRQNTRFIDCDLNRSFLTRQTGDSTSAAYEVDRAREIVQTFRTDYREKRTFAIDLHTTTAHMGITLITNTDPINLAIASDVQKGLKGTHIYCFGDGDRINSCLRAAADGGIGVEIGPIPQGVVRHDTLAITADVVRRILDIIEAFNRGHLAPPDRLQPLYLHDRHVRYPEVPPGAPPAFIHQEIQGRDYTPLHPGHPIFQDLANQVWSYDGSETRYPVFINEAAYYHEGIAFSLTRKVTWETLWDAGGTRPNNAMQ